MGKHIGTGGLAGGKILGRLAFYTWVGLCKERVLVVSYEELQGMVMDKDVVLLARFGCLLLLAIFTKKSFAQFGNQKTIISIKQH